MANSILHYAQRLFWGRKIRQTEIREAPLFIVGHWRTGTTLLHELLTLDERHTSPTTYQCLAPHHFLLTEWCFARTFRFLLPARRPMDDMPMDFDRPQEDEIALCNLGAPSPYRTIAFPNRPPQCRESMDLERMNGEALELWKELFLWFLRAVSLRNPGRIVLKSPTHTCRIKVLLKLFPDARFVHIVRNPYVVFPSTMHLWRSLYAHHSLQHPSLQHLERYVLENFVHLHEKLEEARPAIAASRFCEIRYEDLVENPVESLRAIYERLELEDFESVRPKLESYLVKAAGHSTNSYDLSPEKRETITRHWAHVIRRYGYSCDSPSEKPSESMWTREECGKRWPGSRD